ncbi:Protein mrg2, variant 4 [Lathyrus oleraceus]|uniref:Protein mrg2, variant 4 n=1 Tax=Pisum sativum TaxID=3888 RepID=A0A9D5AFX6_PEA|nr:Protein mrg2, variant 4 [Pisum sativum]
MPQLSRLGADHNEGRNSNTYNFFYYMIPPTLRKQLVDDFEFITHLGKLVKLPRTPNVNDIFKTYFDYRLKKSGPIADSVEEIMKGLCCYFDKALPVMLLYNNERQQYQEACPNDIVPSAIYGAEHLLRLFVKLPELLFHANIEGDTLAELQAQILDFLRFLRKNQRAFFLSSYHVQEDVENSSDKRFCVTHNIT